MTKREKRRLDEAEDFAEQLLEERIAKRKGLEMEKNFFTAIRDALIGVEPIVNLRYGGGRTYEVSQSFDSQVTAVMSSGKEVELSITVTHFPNGSVEVRQYERLRPNVVDSTVRTTENHGTAVVRSFVMRFIREVLS